MNFPSQSLRIFKHLAFCSVQVVKARFRESLSLRCQNEQECCVDEGPVRSTTGSLGPKNTNDTKGIGADAGLLLTSPGRAPFDVKSCLILLCVSAFVLGRQKAVPFQQWGALEYCCHPLKQWCMQAVPRVTGEAGWGWGWCWGWEGHSRKLQVPRMLVRKLRQPWSLHQASQNILSWRGTIWEVYRVIRSKILKSISFD